VDADGIGYRESDNPARRFPMDGLRAFDRATICEVRYVGQGEIEPGKVSYGGILLYGIKGGLLWRSLHRLRPQAPRREDSSIDVHGTDPTIQLWNIAYADARWRMCLDLFIERNRLLGFN